MESSIPHTALIVDATGIVGQNLANRLVAEGWTVHRPHTIIGHAIGNVMNMGSTLAVYASICRETGRPFVFPGSPTQWSGLTDVTDARQLASQIHWAAPYPGHATSLENVLSADAPLWADIAARHGLRENALDRLALPWHTGAELGRPIECVTDMSKSHTLGFTAYQTTPKSFFYLFEILRAQRYIP